MSNKNKLEELFRKRFENQESPVSDRVWENIKQTLPPENNRPGGFPLYIVGILLVGFLSLAWYFIKDLTGSSSRLSENKTEKAAKENNSTSGNREIELEKQDEMDREEFDVPLAEDLNENRENKNNSLIESERESNSNSDKVNKEKNRRTDPDNKTKKTSGNRNKNGYTLENRKTRTSDEKSGNPDSKTSLLAFNKNSENKSGDTKDGSKKNKVKVSENLNENSKSDPYEGDKKNPVENLSKKNLSGDNNPNKDLAIEKENSIEKVGDKNENQEKYTLLTKDNEEDQSKQTEENNNNNTNSGKDNGNRDLENSDTPITALSTISKDSSITNMADEDSIQVKEEENSNDSLSVSEEKKKKDKEKKSILLSADLFGTPALTYRSFSESSNSGAAGNNVEKSRLSMGGGIRINVGLSEKISVNGGLGIATYGEKYKLNWEETSFFELFKYDTVWIQDSTTLYYYIDVDTITTSRETTVQHSGKNTYRYLEIPLSFTYYVKAGKFKIGITGGLSANLLLSAQRTGLSSMPGSSRHQVSEQKSGSNSPFRPITFGAFVNPSIVYQLNDKWAVLAEPGFKFLFNSIYKKDENVFLKPYGVTFNVGLRYIFK